MRTDLPTALIGVAIMSLITFSTRAFPFLIFRNHKPGPRFMRIQETLPALILTILLAYALKDTTWTDLIAATKTLSALFLVVGLHAWKRNALISIFGGTIFYMTWRPVLSLMGL